MKNAIIDKQHHKQSFFKLIFLGILFVLATTFTSFGQTKSEKIDHLMKVYNEQGKFNGSILVAENSSITISKGFGLANMEWNIPNQSNTKHRLASITKQFTAMLIMQLTEQGELNVDIPITTYLPDYPKSTGNIITIHHLLTHTSGIPNFLSFPIFNDISKKKNTPEEIVSVFKDSTLQFTPGEKFNYSNSGYTLLGLIIENVTGKTFEQNLHELIFTPLKMSNSGYDHFETILKNRSTGYERDGENFRNSNYIDMSIPYAAGSIYSTVEDMYLWDQALYTNKLLTDKSKDLMFSSHVPVGPWHYGYGWIIKENSNDNLRILEHNGGINGFNTLISRIPSEKHLVVLINNTGKAPLDEINLAIKNILYNKPYELPKKSIAQSILEVIKTSGITKAIKHFKELKKLDNYALIESEMNAVGYQLLNENKIDDAIVVLKLNTEAFPKSANAYDSLGEAYLHNKNLRLSEKAYLKAIEINPDLKSSIEMSKKEKIKKLN
jgi:CubicO group peptidase (beta-lactamase class C family)